MEACLECQCIEVKAGQPIKADPGAGYVIHLSQASLGESKNKAESVPLYVNANGKKPVYIVIKKVLRRRRRILWLLQKMAPGNAKTDAKTSKANAGKPEVVNKAVKIAEPSKKTEDDDYDSEDESSYDEEDDSRMKDESSSDEEDDSEDEDESDEMSMDRSSDDEDEETPKKVESSKKRPVETATPASSKKAKSAVTPQKTDGRKGGHTAIPHQQSRLGKIEQRLQVWWSAGGGLNLVNGGLSFKKLLRGCFPKGNFELH
ncbi:Histone deacetylase 2C, putative isoform 4 [Hibiscus syriacus]|uniref:Histone deacetylase 2C, putative isoform 4 n=1 Tax=Hibiscus syriacus TaxID=106335 RepID=A0A6A2ZGG6_HIBSY|nr:Histone deacetylase 2C, putative isoform 4 [Hibiscus syriacus]